MSHPDSVAFLLSILVTFLIGFVTAWILWGGKAAKYRKEAVRWKKNYDELIIEQNALKEQLDLKEADLVKAQREAEEAKEQYQLILEEKANWQSELDTALNKVIESETSVLSYQAAIDDLTNQIVGLKTRGAQLSEDSESREITAEHIALTQEIYNTTLARLSSMEEKMDKLIEENDDLKVQLSSLHNDAFEVAMPIAKEVLAAPSEENLVINPPKEVLKERIILPEQAAAAPTKIDDLKIVEGIGPKIEQLLKKANIRTWRNLSETSLERLREILLAAGSRYRIHDPATWPEQAKLAADGEWEKLKEYQDFLIGGRNPG